MLACRHSGLHVCRQSRRQACLVACVPAFRASRLLANREHPFLRCFFSKLLTAYRSTGNQDFIRSRLPACWSACLQVRRRRLVTSGSFGKSREGRGVRGPFDACDAPCRTPSHCSTRWRRLHRLRCVRASQNAWPGGRPRDGCRRSRRGHPLDLALRAAGVLGSFAGVGKGFPGRAMPHTYAAYATEPWQSFDTVQMLDAEAAVAEAITRARSIRVDKLETSRRTAGLPRAGRCWRERTSNPWHGRSGRPSEPLAPACLGTAGRSSGAMWRDGWG